MWSGNFLAVEWLNVGKAATDRSNVEQLRFVLNEHGQLGSKFVDRVIELMMQMVVGADLVMGQLMEKQRVLFERRLRVDVSEVNHHDAPLPGRPFLGPAAPESLAEAAL